MKPKQKMTGQWEKILRFIKAYIKLHGVSPSYAVMAHALGMKSRSNIHRMVKRLEEEGHLQRKPRKIYGLKVVDRSVRDVASL